MSLIFAGHALEVRHLGDVVERRLEALFAVLQLLLGAIDRGGVLLRRGDHDLPETGLQLREEVADLAGALHRSDGHVDHLVDLAAERSDADETVDTENQHAGEQKTESGLQPPPQGPLHD